MLSLLPTRGLFKYSVFDLKIAFPTFRLWLSKSGLPFWVSAKPMLQISTHLSWLPCPESSNMPVLSPSYAAGRVKSTGVAKRHLGRISVNAEVSSFNSRDQSVIAICYYCSGKFSSEVQSHQILISLWWWITLSHRSSTLYSDHNDKRFWMKGKVGIGMGWSNVFRGRHNKAFIIRFAFSSKASMQRGDRLDLQWPFRLLHQKHNHRLCFWFARLHNRGVVNFGRWLVLYLLLFFRIEWEKKGPLTAKSGTTVMIIKCCNGLILR